MNSDGYPIGSAFPDGVTADALISLDETSSIELGDGEINLIAANVFVNGFPITGENGYVTNPMAIDLNANEYSITNAGSVQAAVFIKAGGTNQQYLMADGSSLQYSANSGNSNFYLYNNGTDLNPTPQNGYITYNTAIQDDATFIYISHRTRDTIDIEVFFKNLSTLNEVYIQDQENSANSITYNIIGMPIIVDQAQVTIPVTRASSFGTGITSFGNGHNLLLSFFTNSIETDGRLTILEEKSQNITATASQNVIEKNSSFVLRVADADSFVIRNDDTPFSQPKFVVSNTSAQIFSVPLLMNGQKITLLAEPTDSKDSATKNYVDTADALKLNLTGGTLTGSVTATAFIQAGGTFREFLKANGDVAAFENIRSQRLNNLYYNPTTDLTSYSMNMDSWRYCSWGYSGLTNIVVDTPTASIIHQGGSLASITINSAILPKGYKIRTGSNVSSQTNGAVSGWLGATVQSFLSPRAGYHIKIGFALDATQTTASNRTMIGLFQSTTRPTLDSTNTIAAVTTGSMGIIQERNETVFSFNTRGPSGSTKIATTISCQTPNNYWYTLEMINEPMSATITMILTCQTDVDIQTDTATFICGGTNTMPLTLSYIQLQQNIANPGAPVGSAVLSIGNVGIRLAQ